MDLQMDKLSKEWLGNLYKGEIREERKTIANEQAWLDGSAGDTSRECHLGNIRSHRKYLDVLESLLKELDHA